VNCPRLMALHWWCMRQAQARDGLGYPWRAAVYDRLGGYASRLWQALR
jgi:hypothetical protein